MLATACDVRCPLTDSPDVRLVETIATRPLIDQWQQLFGVDIEPELDACEAMQLYESPAAGLRFFHPAAVAGSDRLYEQLNALPWYYLPHRWEHQQALRDLRGSHRALEIGCGEGAFVQRMLEAGLEAEGLEINSRAAATAARRGLPVRLADLHEIAAQRPRSYDAVCSFQVLEHVPDPRAFLESAAALVRPGGKLLLAVPNQESYLQHLPHPLNMPPHHMTQWTAAAFRSLEGMLNVRVAAIRREPLARCHVPGYITAYGGHYREKSPLLWNDWTLWTWKRSLKLGLRRWCVGQCLYVALEVGP